ncbi:MAG: hypothetical protein EXR71_18200 [Myxococcales bacterium]|nr:hypothetical protein [Myxococcales bacterium]
MRFNSFLTVAFFACAPESQTPEVTESPLASGPTVSFEFPMDGIKIALRSVRYDEEGAATVGSVLRSATIADGEVSINLPARAARRDRDPSFPDAPVAYQVFAYADMPEGQPDTYYGVGEESVVYFNGKDGGKKGWYVQATDEDGTITWSSTDRIVSIPSRLLGPSAASIRGTVGDIAAGDLRLAFEGPDGVVDANAPIGGTFEAEISGAPSSPSELDDGMVVAQVTPRVYVDIDGSKAFEDGEPLVGEICWGMSPVYMGWVDGAHSVEQALDFVRAGVRTGWHAWAETDGGAQLVAPGADIQAQENCPTEAMLPDGNEPG